MAMTVHVVKSRGVIVKCDTPAEMPQVHSKWQVYRVVNNVETIVGTGSVRKPIGADSFKLNPDQPFAVPAQVGDLVRAV